MAKQTPPITDNEPLARMTEETMEHIDAIKAELDQAANDLDSLEELGLDTSRLREKINWGYKAREVILKTFNNKG